MRKIFYISYNNLFGFIKRNKFIFSMFLLGCTICSLLFVFFWGNIRYAIVSSFADSYEATLSQYAEFSLDDTLSLMDKYGVEADFICNVGVEAIEKNTGEEYNKDYYVSHLESGISVFCSNNAEKIYIWGCEHKDLEKDGVIVVPEMLTSGFGAPEKLVFGEVSVKVIGQTASKFFLVSKDTYKELGLVPTTINITTDAEMSDKDKTAFLNEFNSVTGNSYTIRETNEQFEFETLLKTMAPSILVYLLCMSSMLYIITYMFEISRREFSVYMLTGAEEKTIIKINLGIQTMILLSANLLAVVLHKVFYKLLFAKINYFVFNYSFVVYFESVVVTTILCLVVMNVYMKYKFNSNIVVGLRQADN